MVAPLSVILLCNYTLFVITVVHIYRVRSLQAGSQDDKSQLVVYVKLSSMTGAFWLLAIIAEPLDSDVLRYTILVYCYAIDILMY